MRALFCLLLLTGVVSAADTSRSGTRITPPTLREIAPRGIPRGGTVEVSIIGYNLAHASAIYFTEPSIKARITRIKELSDQDDVRLGGNGTPLTVDLGPLPVRNEVTAEVDVPFEAPIGAVNYRVLTPLGLSPQGTLAIEPYYGETADREPNDLPEVATETYLPTVLVGSIDKPGDLDYYKIKVAAGEQLVFESNGLMLGSKLETVVTISDESSNQLKQFVEDGARQVNTFAYRFEKAGHYLVAISDYRQAGSPGHFYRVMVGKMPAVLSAFPLGVERGKTAEATLNGFNLAQPKMTVKGVPNEGEYDSLWIRPAARSGSSFTKIRLAIGEEPEILARGSAEAQPVSIPVTINGKMIAQHQDFRFHARKNQELTLEVEAARFGSPLDSQLEILDAKGQPVERATVRAILQTALALRDSGSTDPGLRLESVAGLHVGDDLMVGTEIVQIDAMPRGPDDDCLMRNFNGQRIAFLDTTPEAHAIDTPVYKVQFHPPGAKFAPNGLPLVRLKYRNDDGGAGYGKDSKLRFLAPADGEYTVRLRDVRGLTGEEYAYRLTIREPHPDYRLSVNPRNPNVPAGGRIPLTVTTLRLDGFEGAIPVAVRDLPPGLHATSGFIAPGEKATTLILSADADAKLPEAVPLRVVDGKGRVADPEEHLTLLAMMPRADIDVKAETHEVALEPGGRATIEVSISRNNGFGGRVPLAVRNLPPTVRVIDVGLNGVLVNENETKRTFTLEALPSAEPMDHPIYVSGDIETRAAQQNSFLTEPITLHIKKSSKQELSRK